jgi:hypothetical protein
MTGVYKCTIKTQYNKRDTMTPFFTPIALSNNETSALRRPDASTAIPRSYNSLLGRL